MARSKLDKSLARLTRAEEEFLTREFLAPVVSGGVVHVRIAGVVCRLQLQPADFQGWGVFRPQSHVEAELVRPARLAERQRYLNLLPAVRLILTRRNDAQWLAIPAHRGDGRFRIEGLVPARLVDEGQLFDVIVTRFDGSQFWFEGSDTRRDPATASYLRESLARMLQPDMLSRSGLTAEERTAYAINYWPRLRAEIEAARDRVEERLRDALAHAGAELRGYLERDDVYSVTYEISGERHVSVVSKKDLTVQVAGICLSGQDENFDLTSLVGVIREAQGGGGIVRVGNENAGMPERQYWRVHPRRRGRLR
jgi:hypothetical protein